MTLGELIKRKRKDSGLTQKEVADHMGYTSPQFVSNWTRGISKPPLKDAKKLCQLLNIDPEDYKDIVFDEFEQQLEGAFE